MRAAYRVLAYLLALEVVVQAAAIAWAVFGLSTWIEDGGVLDKAGMESDSTAFDGVLGFAVHGINGQMIVPAIAMAASSGEIASGCIPPSVMMAVSTLMLPTISSSTAMPLWPNRPSAQVAATAALNGPQECVAEMRALYRERRDVLVRGLAQAGWDMPSPDGSMFAWAPIPPRYAHLGSVEFSKLLLARAKVAVAPGIGFGEHGDTHVRIALVENTQRLRQAVRNVRGFLGGDSNRAESVGAEAATA